jgi:hypothetical protein
MGGDLDAAENLIAQAATDLDHPWPPAAGGLTTDNANSIYTEARRLFGKNDPLALGSYEKALEHWDSIGARPAAEYDDGSVGGGYGS